MRLASFIASSVCGILVLGPGSGLLAQSGTGGSPRSGWYIGGGIGSNWASDLDQEGWNRETTCYPTDACFDANPVPEISGYHWRYGIDADAGAAFEISAGRIFDRIRLELSLTQRKNNLNQISVWVDYYLSPAVHERALGAAGLRAIEWLEPELSPEWDGPMDYWDDFLDDPPVIFLQCRK